MAVRWVVLGRCDPHNSWIYGHVLGKIPWRREWLPTPVFLPGEFHGQRSLVGYSLWARKKSDMTERLTLSLHWPAKPCHSGQVFWSHSSLFRRWLIPCNPLSLLMELKTAASSMAQLRTPSAWADAIPMRITLSARHAQPSSSRKGSWRCYLHLFWHPRGEDTMYQNSRQGTSSPVSYFFLHGHLLPTVLTRHLVSVDPAFLLQKKMHNKLYLKSK